MTLNKEDLKNKIIYRASYRGTKEMGNLLSSFGKKNINNFNETELHSLEEFLKFEDETILNFYNFDIVENNINKNPISKIFKRYKI